MRIGAGHLDRLEHVRELLSARSGLDTSGTRLLLASAAGFSDALLDRARHRPDIVLVDLDRIYNGE